MSEYEVVFNDGSTVNVTADNYSFNNGWLTFYKDPTPEAANRADKDRRHKTFTSITSFKESLIIRIIGSNL